MAAGRENFIFFHCPLDGLRFRFHGTVLAFIALEYALWTASCFWVSDTLTNPYFWFDFLLTLVLLLFLPAVRKAVEA